MLSLLKIRNIALIDELGIEFAAGLNLLTGETGSGKSIIVDSLGALTGDRVSSDIVKEGESTARIEGIFQVRPTPELIAIFEESAVELEGDGEVEVIVRRELSLTGKNRIIVNDQIVTQAFLKRIGPFLVDIHGQGDQASLTDASNYLDMLDGYAGLLSVREKAAVSFGKLRDVRTELRSLREDEAQKLQLLDLLRFQVEELEAAKLTAGEDEALEEEKRRLNNAEKLSALSEESYLLLYENPESTVTTLDKVARKIEELSQFDSGFATFNDGLADARALLEDLAYAVRDFSSKLDFSPDRLDEIENRLAEIGRLKRKYGGTIENAIAHFEEVSSRLRNIETAELREKELEAELGAARSAFLEDAVQLHDRRVKNASKMAREIEENLKAVALEKARFEIRVIGNPDDDDSFGPAGFDRVEFLFSANPGESVKPIGKVASGGELSRLMLVLRTIAIPAELGKTMVFDEIDTGIGGRVAEAVGLKLKQLAGSQQVLCVTHQPQVASLADHHFVVSKSTEKSRTLVAVRELDRHEKVEELARMLAGETISDTARQHAREMLGVSGKR